MLTVIEGRGLDLPFFKIEDEELFPDTGSVSVNVTSLDKTPIIISGEDTPTLALQIPQGSFSVKTGELASFYNLRVDFMIDGQDNFYYDIVRVIKDLPITVTGEAVQNILGVTEQEVPSETIDVYGYYVELYELLDLDIFSDLTKVVKANQLLAYFCAFRELDSLPLKLLQTFSVDDYKRSRFSTVEFRQLQGIISQKYWELRSLFDSSGALPQESLVSFGARTDVITGA